MSPQAVYTSRQLRDLQEIRDLKMLYGRLVDEVCSTRHAGAVRLVDAVFTAGSRIDSRSTSGRFIEGREAMIAHFEHLVTGPTAWMWHRFSNPQISFVGADRAAGRWLHFALATSRAAPQARPNITYGHYEDEYVRTAQGWRIAILGFKNETRQDDDRSVVIKQGGVLVFDRTGEDGGRS
jgi:hypothetical protein